MSHDRGCSCGKEPYEYVDCLRSDCDRGLKARARRDNRIKEISDSFTKVHKVFNIPDTSTDEDVVKLVEEKVEEINELITLGKSRGLRAEIRTDMAVDPIGASRRLTIEFFRRIET